VRAHEVAEADADADAKEEVVVERKGEDSARVVRIDIGPSTR
jgi:hypothetical protein